MDVIVGVVRDIEIEHMTDIGNIEAPRCYVGGHKQRHFVLAKLLQGGRAGLLVHVPMERDGGKSMANERAMQGRNFALAIAENNCVLETDGGANEPPQRLAFFGRLAAGFQQILCGVSDGAGRTGNLHADRLSGTLGGGRPCSSLGRIGSTNAAFFPVPVWAMPSTSGMTRTCGIGCSWIGVGVTNPAEVAAASTLSDKPRSENDIKPQNLTAPCQRPR